MPNWCVNRLQVKGPRCDIDAYYQLLTHCSPERALATRLEGGEPTIILDYNDLIPYPEEFVRLDAIANAARNSTPPNYDVSDGYNSGGYEWCVKYWGTKWNASAVVRRSRNVVQFNSPWTPPLPIIRAMGQRFPTLTFTLRYYEGGAGFQGCYQVRGSTILHDTHAPYRGALGG